MKTPIDDSMPTIDIQHVRCYNLDWVEWCGREYQLRHSEVWPVVLETIDGNTIAIPIMPGDIIGIPDESGHYVDTLVTGTYIEHAPGKTTMPFGYRLDEIWDVGEQ